MHFYIVFSTRVFTRFYHLTSLILNSLIIFFILYKVLYNLKQAPHACFSRLSFKFLSLGLIGSINDLSLFILKSTYINLFVLIYMDGIFITGLNILYIQTLITQLHLKKYPKRSWSIEFFHRHWVSPKLFPWYHSKSMPLHYWPSL